jgi:hypothetical protein
MEGDRPMAPDGYFIAQPEGGGVLRAEKMPKNWKPGQPVTRGETVLSIQVHPEMDQRVFLVAVPSDQQIERRAKHEQGFHAVEFSQQYKAAIERLMETFQPEPGDDYSI